MDVSFKKQTAKCLGKVTHFDPSQEPKLLTAAWVLGTLLAIPLSCAFGLPTPRPAPAAPPYPNGPSTCIKDALQTVQDVVVGRILHNVNLPDAMKKNDFSLLFSAGSLSSRPPLNARCLQMNNLLHVGQRKSFNTEERKKKLGSRDRRRGLNEWCHCLLGSVTEVLLGSFYSGKEALRQHHTGIF